MDSNLTSDLAASLSAAPLGKSSAYVDQYDPSLLFPIPRHGKRLEIGISGDLPFTGADIWNGYELSWLNLRGKPIVALARFSFPCESPFLVESKSFKLYLNSFNQSCFDGFEAVQDRLIEDLSAACGALVSVEILSVSDQFDFGRLPGSLLDDLDVSCSDYLPQPSLLATSDVQVEETSHSHLLKSNCLVTGQPDWGSLLIRYEGRQLDRQGLLRYIVSLRNHNEFHEQCVERIFMDLMKRCAPEKLLVMAFYTRRGGLDINPMRCFGFDSSFLGPFERLPRQ